MDTDGDGIPGAAEKALGTNPNSSDTDGDGIDDKQDPAPSFAQKPQASVGPNTFQVTGAIVENNVGADGKDTADHLEIMLKSSSTSATSDFIAYYTVRDAAANRTEAYIVFLTGFVLLPGQSQSIHIDLVSASNHFGANPNGLFYTSTEALQISVFVDAAGFAEQTATVAKDAGGAEGPE
ncbi:MAG: hypothetical protein WC876_03455 [Candidatus Thermoplasmatota archaeon]